METKTMKKWIYPLILGTVFLLITSSFAVTIEITGILIDKSTGEPLPGANVYVKGTSVGTATNTNGEFKIVYEADKNFTLIISFMGYKTQKINISPTQDLRDMTIELVEDIFRTEEIVVTGIASKTSKSLAEVAVSRLAADELTMVNSYQDVSQLVTGKVVCSESITWKNTSSSGFLLTKTSIGVCTSI